MSEMASFRHPDFGEDWKGLPSSPELLAAEYQDRLHMFRMRVFEELQNYGVGEYRGWLFYQFTDFVGIDEFDEDQEGHDADCLILVEQRTVMDGPVEFHVRPNIRIIYSVKYDFSKILNLYDGKRRSEYFTTNRFGNRFDNDS